MNIYAVHEYLAGTFLPDVEVDDDLRIKRAYAFTPAADKTLTDLPCAMIPGFELNQTEFKPAWLKQQFGIHLQVYIAKSAAEQDLRMAKASKLLNAIGFALSADQRLGNTVSIIRGLRTWPYSTGEGALTGFEWAGVKFVGLDLMLDVELITTAQHATREVAA